MIRRGPWTTTDAAVLLATEAVGFVLIVLAWYGTSGQLTPNRQTAWIAAGAAGLILAGAGNASWLIRARRSIGERRASALLGPTGILLERRRSRAVPESSVVSVRGAGRYHRPTCPLVVGKVVAASTVEAEAAHGRRPCGVCAP